MGARGTRGNKLRAPVLRNVLGKVPDTQDPRGRRTSHPLSGRPVQHSGRRGFH